MRKSKSKAVATVPAIALKPGCASCRQPLPADWELGKFTHCRPCLADSLRYLKVIQYEARAGVEALREQALKHHAARPDEPLQSDTTVLSFRAITSSGYVVQDRTYIEVHSEPRKRKSLKH